jgi:nicotinamidase-related amidase
VVQLHYLLNTPLLLSEFMGPLQIFHPIFWMNAAGDHPQPATTITAADLAKGTWQVNPNLRGSLSYADLQTYAHHYVTQLEQSGKYPLTVWPYHAMLGGVGHALVPAVESACFCHGIARQTQTRIELKGNHPLTENYSVLSPEVRSDAKGKIFAPKNAALIQSLLAFDRVIIAGQAKSHCVAWTIADLLSEILVSRPTFVEQVYLLTDCTSPVVISGVVDFTTQADAAFARFADAGMHLVTTTTPLKAWPKFLG